MEIKSVRDPIAKYFTHLILSKEFREEQKRVAVSGEKRVLDLIKHHSYCHLLVNSQYPLSPAIKDPIWVSEELLRKITRLPSAPSLLADFPMPEESPLDSYSFILALDGIQDPGNLGTLYRTAEALGWEAIFLLPGCADPFNDKAIRASEGTVLSLPYCHGNIEQLIRLQKKNNIPTFAASMEGKPPKTEKEALLILGSEGKGLSLAIREAFSSVSIPMKGNTNSLNVSAAGAILMAMIKGF